MPAITIRFRRATLVAATLSLCLAIGASPEGQGRGGGGAGPVGGAGRAGGAGPAGAGGRQGGRGGVGRDQAGPAVGTGAIKGVVVLDGGGAPVRRARVQLSGVELRGPRTAISDEQGQFSFDLLPAGRFTMTASKAGFVDMTYGAKRPGRPGTPIQLADGQQLDKMVIAMPRGSVITGTVVDEHGDPSPGTMVRALRVVMRTGEKTLQQAGQDQTDDRGIYRIFQLQAGDYIVNAMPRNMNATDLTDFVAVQAEQLRATLAQGGGGGGGRGGGALLAAVGVDPAALSSLAGPAAQQILDRIGQLQQTAGADAPQNVVYAPVYYPGTTAPSGAMTVTLASGQERTGVDFQLQLVATAKVSGVVVSPDGQLPPGTQVALMPSDRSGIPGLGLNVTRADAAGRFTFRDVTPGQYSVQARAAVRSAAADANAVDAAGGRGRGAGGRGGRGGFPGGGPAGPIEQVLWAASDVTVAGQDISDLSMTLQPGMTVSGRIEFQSNGAQPPTDLSRVRVSLTTRGQQVLQIGGVPPADVDESGRFTIKGVAPGKYMLNGNVPPNGGQNGQNGLGQGNGRAGAGGALGARGQGAAAGGAAAWTLKSAVVGGHDTLDFPIDIAPNQDVADATLVFTDRTQELSGTIQDGSGRPAPDFTIIVFPADNRYWLPEARRIVSTRPGTDGKFSVRGLPSGDYRLTAVTDVEPGEWYDPAFLTQLQNASIPVALKDGEKKVQDVKLAASN